MPPNGRHRPDSRETTWKLPSSPSGGSGLAGFSCLFIAELFTFTALAHFEDEIVAVVALSLFVPLCISTGGTQDRRRPP